MNTEDARLDRVQWTILILSMAGSAGLAILLGQDSGFDLLNYHFYSAFAFLHKPFGYDFAPAQIQSFHNPLVHVLSYLALGNLTAKAAAALLGAIQGLNFYFVFRICQVLFAEFRKSYRCIMSLSCAAAGFYGIASTTELGATYGDNLISILVLAGLLLVLRRLRTGDISGRRASAAFAVAGLLIGAAFGLKFTAAVYLLGILVSVPLATRKAPNRARLALSLICGLVIGFLATYGYWGTKLYASYRNPFFPYLNKYFRSPFYDWSNFLDARFFPRDWIQSLFYPFFFAQKNQLVSEIGFRDVRLAMCYVAIVLLLGIGMVRFIGSKRNRDSAGPARHDSACLFFLAIFFAVSFVSWLYLSSIYRYLSVLELTAPALLALTVGRLIRKQSPVFWLSLGLNIIIVATAIPIDFGRQKFDDDLLRAEPPRLGDFEKSTILMTGYEPTAFIVPSFPASTRFVRISSTFVTPGRNSFQDGEIRKMLASQDDRHLFAYVKSGDEMGLSRLDAAFYGKAIDADSCYEIRPQGRNRGYLCGMMGARPETNEKPVPTVGYVPRFKNMPGVQLNTIRVYEDYRIACFRVSGKKAEMMDILYTVNGELMPVVRRWSVSPPSDLNFGPLSRNGAYRVIGIRDSNEGDPDLWVAVDARVDIGHEELPSPPIKLAHFNVSKTEMFRSWASLSKNGTAFSTVWVLIRKLPSIAGRRGRAAGQF
jgi:hypothetical protein